MVPSLVVIAPVAICEIARNRPSALCGRQQEAKGMDILLREQGRFTVVSPRMRLDTGTAPDAQRQLSALLDRGVRQIVVDFSEVAYVASAGLRVLLSTAKRIRASGGELRVCCLNETVREVFDISGFSELLPVFASTGDAVREA
jgi:anti-anti-sigma factor